MNRLEFNARELVELGIIDGSRAYIGPEVAEIDLTNNCNLHCAGCWCHSRLLGESMFSGEKKKEYLPGNIIKRLVDDLCDMGTETVQLSGSGEPFMHPEITEIIDYIKLKPLRCNIITNFTLVNEKIVARLIDSGVDNITVSLWAAQAATYGRTHPGVASGTFERIKDNLKRLSREKKGSSPKVKIYNVISRLNCGEMEAMLDLALDVGADFLEFALIDIIPGKTDSLALTDKDKKTVLESVKAIKRRVDYPYKGVLSSKSGQNNRELSPSQQKTPGFNLGMNAGVFREGCCSRRKLNMGSVPAKLNFAGKREEPRTPGRGAPLSGGYYDKFLKPDSRLNGFDFNWDDYSVICPRGIRNEDVYLDDAGRSEFVFVFSRQNCLVCPDHADCVIDKEDSSIRKGFLSLLGFDHFAGNIDEASGAALKGSGSMPCYAGWIYSRIRVDGNVIPCCKAHQVPVGNLHDSSFQEIWNSALQDEFRSNSKVLSKDNVYFSGIGCLRGCDNIQDNVRMHEHLNALDEKRISELKSLASLIGQERFLAPGGDFFRAFLRFRSAFRKLQYLQERIKKEIGERDKFREESENKDALLLKQRKHYDGIIDRLTELNKKIVSERDGTFDSQRRRFEDIIVIKENIIKDQEQGLKDMEDNIKARDERLRKLEVDSERMQAKYASALKLLKEQEDKLKSDCELAGRMQQELALLQKGDFNLVFKHYNCIIEKMRDEVKEVAARCDSSLASQNDYFIRIIKEKDAIIAGLSLRQKAPGAHAKSSLYSWLRKAASLGVLTWLLFIKVMADIYMLVLRVLLKKRIFPGG